MYAGFVKCPPHAIMSMPTPEIDDLVVAAQEGDKDAFGEIYDLFFEKIYRYVYFRVNGEEVDDIVETVFIKAWTKLEKYAPQKDASFNAWLFRIAHNSVIDHRRTHRSILPIDPRLQDVSDRAAPEKQTEKVMMAQMIREEVNQLKEPYRQVVTLKFLTGLSNAEIAEVLEQKEGNVRVMQFRALKELRRRLEERGIKSEIIL